MHGKIGNSEEVEEEEDDDDDDYDDDDEDEDDNNDDDDSNSERCAYLIHKTNSILEFERLGSGQKMGSKYCPPSLPRGKLPYPPPKKRKCSKEGVVSYEKCLIYHTYPFPPLTCLQGTLLQGN